ncbi:MoaD/ThiS family protein [Opacimonas viscosa]|uniref:Molybdopterin synthase sulfur carrier subunit n=1 Tax=Opacimonas viscosa TaxID=2961944 RepID=A0AA41X2C0_9ALTE|nr:MoaD/ThiS family protein [Opacimonas viscosa]MCP3428211.1 MoaD/ThiS family protein [Opacimonas viscosa]
MFKVLFFGQLADMLDCRNLSMPASSAANVYDLLDILRERDPKWSKALNTEQLMMAVNHTLVTPEHPIVDGDEVAIFPPVTGG